VTTNPYYSAYGRPGEEVSSSQEGRIVSLLESDLVHVDNGDGLVDKGQPVSFGIGWAGCGVGIALRSAGAATDVVTVDTEGLWRCTVVAEFAVIVGQIIFITSAGVLVDWPPDAECHIFGYAMQPMNAGTDLITVKVHWMDTGIWWWWFWWWQQEVPKL